MDTAWTWELSDHCAKYSFLTESKGLTMREVERIFQLDPEPPAHENLNDYIIKAVQRREQCWFSFFLHRYENRLNGRVRRFLLREGLDRYDPERFSDYKMGCVLAMLDCLRGIRSRTRGRFSDLCPSFYRECPFDLPDAGGGRFL